MKRREFIKRTAAAGVGLGAIPALNSPAGATPVMQGKPSHPVVVSSANGRVAVNKAIEMMKAGSDPLEAVVEGVTLVENDPDDITVGYGGLPNEDGVIQLDASVMHGPTHNCGAVAAIENIKNPARVAKLVMERTDHVLIVGEGAKRFARAHGFREEDLMTPKTRRIWLKWKEELSDQDDWLAGPEDEYSALVREYREHYGTINCCAVDTNGNLGGVTTTSGLSFKIPGRVGDSPIIGAGLYVDNEVGAAGSTGRGEANLKNLCSFLVIEFMRQGKSPEAACLEVCKRIVQNTKLDYLLTRDGKPDFNVKFYAVSKSGQVGGAAVYGPATFMVGDEKGVREEPVAHLYEDKNR